MSLDISLYALDRDSCDIEVWSTNITHNLAEMAQLAGLYEVMWQPHENSIDMAMSAIPHLESGIKLLVKDRKKMQKLNPENGWGDYDGLLGCAGEYLLMCRKYPSARIEVDR